MKTIFWSPPLKLKSPFRKNSGDACESRFAGLKVGDDTLDTARTDITDGTSPRSIDVVLKKDGSTAPTLESTQVSSFTMPFYGANDDCQSFVTAKTSVPKADGLPVDTVALNDKGDEMSVLEGPFLCSEEATTAELLAGVQRVVDCGVGECKETAVAILDVADRIVKKLDKLEKAGEVEMYTKCSAEFDVELRRLIVNGNATLMTLVDHYSASARNDMAKTHKLLEDQGNKVESAMVGSALQLNQLSNDTAKSHMLLSDMNCCLQDVVEISAETNAAICNQLSNDTAKSHMLLSDINRFLQDVFEISAETNDAICNQLTYAEMIKEMHEKTNRLLQNESEDSKRMGKMFESFFEEINQDNVEARKERAQIQAGVEQNGEGIKQNGEAMGRIEKDLKNLTAEVKRLVKRGVTGASVGQIAKKDIENRILKRELAEAKAKLKQQHGKLKRSVFVP